MTAESFAVTAADGQVLAGYRWPLAEPRGSVVIAHGMGEHAGRYDRAARALNEAGFAVYSYDQRGHGATAPDSLGQLGPGGWPGLISDIGAVVAVARAEHGGRPVVAFGHSMGSFGLQSYLLDHSGDVDAAVLCGTSALDLIAAGIDPNAEVDLSAFNALIDNPRTDSDWLSRDPAEVDAYIADPWCGFGLSADDVGGMASAAAETADPQRLAGIRSDIPIYLMSGDADPLAGGGELVQLVAQRYRDAGVGDVTVALYPGARHELLNETNRDEVTAALTSWLTSRTSSSPTP